MGLLASASAAGAARALAPKRARRVRIRVGCIFCGGVVKLGMWGCGLVCGCVCICVGVEGMIAG